MPEGVFSTIAYHLAVMAMKSSMEWEPHCGKSVRETDPLRILEILARVLELASLGGKATAARVCRGWSSPALDMLWQDLTDVAPFLNIFALLKQVESSRMSSAEALERIKCYGSRVRTLRFDASNSSILRERGPAEVYRAICDHDLDQYLPTVPIPSSGLFPNLHTLVWKAQQPRAYEESTLDAVSYFLCPSLKHLYVWGIMGQLAEQSHGFVWGPNVDCAPFFHTLNAMNGLRLESLELRGREYAEELTQDHEVGLFLRRNQDTLHHFYTWTPEFVRLFQKEIWGLGRLRSLEVVADNELQATELIEGLADGTPDMESLHLTVLPFEQPQKWQGLWNAMKRLRKLTKLHLEVPEIEELDEGDARSMGETWPTLSYLYIVQKYGGWRDPSRGLSLDFLSAISLHFSKSLTELGLCLGPNLRSAQPISPVRFEKLRLLYIQSSSIPEAPEGLVQYLAHILPPEADFKGDLHFEWRRVVHRLERIRGEVFCVIESVIILNGVLPPRQSISTVDGGGKYLFVTSFIMVSS
ncbi:hypothetical protein FRC01_000083 [Tulasnella sp. 417]|nr:hypothetical protein FRC01_000083 [Tulasnella sp. 417]